MKVTVTREHKEGIEASSRIFPWLGIHFNSVVVEFFNENDGIVRKAGTLHKLHKYSGDWAITSFAPFNGKIEIEND